jgi:sodium pump decarboxylase gamma subunit
MLSGQQLEFLDTIYISVAGMGIVMFELALLALFVWLLSKVVGSIGKKQIAPAAVQTPAPVPTPVPVAAGSVLSDDEMAAVLTVICEDSGLAPEELVFRSIEVK